MVKIDKREWNENIFITFQRYFDMINFRMLSKGVVQAEKVLSNSLFVKFYKISAQHIKLLRRGISDEICKL